jgi:hypothetical protein
LKIVQDCYEAVANFDFLIDSLSGARSAADH